MPQSLITVLIIDDSEADRELLRRFLNAGPRSFRILQSDSCAEGWELCLKERPDCLLLDYQMPELDGLNFLTSLTKEENLNFLPVLMMTGQGDESIAAEAFKTGAADYLIKGKITAEGIHRAVTKAVEKSVLLKTMERQRAEIARSQGELEQFAHTASHDLQAPVRRILKFLELLEQEMEGNINVRARDYLNRAQRGAVYMRQFIQDLLQYSLVGGSEQPFEVVNLNEVVKTVLGQLEETFASVPAKIEVDNLPTVRGNRTFLQHLFQNLIGNALKFHGETPLMIKVSATRKGSMWDCSVQDNGLGVPLEDCEKIFGVFYRGDHGGAFEGTGIGLALCKKVITLHQGKIWVNSRPGEGSTFHFTLPILQQTEPLEKLSCLPSCHASDSVVT
ncbi:MAG: ATP-binding protein [Nitrospirales bacterium]